VGAKIDMELELKWDENDKDGLRLLAFSPPQPAVNRHPITGAPQTTNPRVSVKGALFA